MGGFQPQFTGTYNPLNTRTCGRSRLIFIFINSTKKKQE
jgi:hypothetical protein